VLENRGDVLEEDSRLREIGDISDHGGSEQLLGHGLKMIPAGFWVLGIGFWGA
jgi:hypothetical protein